MLCLFAHAPGDAFQHREDTDDGVLHLDRLLGEDTGDIRIKTTAGVSRLRFGDALGLRREVAGHGEKFVFLEAHRPGYLAQYARRREAFAPLYPPEVGRGDIGNVCQFLERQGYGDALLPDYLA